VSSNAIISAFAVACALGVAGCEATFTPAEPVVTYYGGGVLAPVSAVPPDIWAYPRVYYGGSYVYLMNGAWYQPTRSGWMVYRREPVELSRERTRFYATPGRAPGPVYRGGGGYYPRGYPAYPAAPVPRQAPVELNRERTPLP
jgi:hypothetical protein